MPGRYTGILKGSKKRHLATASQEAIAGAEDSATFYNPSTENEAKMTQEGGFFFEDKSHASDVLVRMNTIRKEGHFCDAIIIIQGHSIPVHKVVLASSCVFFFELFSKSSSASSSDKHQYNLDDTHMDFRSLQHILNYFYTSKLQCGYEGVRDLYKTANYLKLSSILDNSFQYMLKCLSPHNCLGTYVAIGDVETKEHLEVVKTFVQSYMDVILESSLEFSQLSCIVVDIVGTTPFDFSVTEQPLCKLVAQWLRNESLETPVEDMLDKKYMLLLTPENTLVDCMDVQQMNCDLIEDYKNLCSRKQNHEKDKNHLSIKLHENHTRVPFQFEDKLPTPKKTPVDSKYGLVATTIVAENSFMSIMQLKGTLVSVSIKFKSDQSLSRRLSSSSSTSIASNYSGQCTSNHTESGCLDDFSIEMRRSQCLLNELCPMSVPRCGFGVAFIDNQIFVAGGYGRTECLNSVESYSLERNSWISWKAMPTVRGRFSAGVLDDELVVCGGSDGANELSSVVIFNPKTNSWRNLPDMLFARSNAGVAVCDGKLYVIGGLSGSKTLTNCEVFEPELNKWSCIADLNTGRSQAAVCVFKVPGTPSLARGVPGEHHIAVLGGSNSWNCMSLCDSYTPSSNSWHSLPPLSVARRGAGAAFFNGMLYVVGGSDGQMTLNSVEIYDPSLGHWTFASNLCVPRANMGAVVMGKMFFLVGGFGGKSFLKSQEYLESSSDEWVSYLQADINVDKLLECAKANNVSSPSPSPIHPNLPDDNKPSSIQNSHLTNGDVSRNEHEDKSEVGREESSCQPHLPPISDPQSNLES